MDDRFNASGWLVAGIILGAVFWAYVAYTFIPRVEHFTPLHKVQKVMKCTSPFDIYMTDEYEIVDDLLITSYGRVYNLIDCTRVSTVHTRNKILE